TEVTVEEMLVVCKAVRRGAQRALVSCDVPANADAVTAGRRLVDEGRADMIKVHAAPEVVKQLARAGVAVFAEFHGGRPVAKLLEHLPQKFRCIVFDRRECGQSAGRIELITWTHYARHGKLLLEHLGIERAHLIGGCMGCSCVMAFAVAHPAATLSMLLWWPV